MRPQNLSATLVVLVIGAAIPRPAVSQNRWEREVQSQLQRAVNAVSAESIAACGQRGHDERA